MLSALIKAMKKEDKQKQKKKKQKKEQQQQSTQSAMGGPPPSTHGSNPPPYLCPPSSYGHPGGYSYQPPPLIGLDRLNDDGWNVVWSPLGQAPSEEPEEEDQRANSDEEGESNFEGYGSEDSEETQPYPMPEESGDEHEETQDEEEFAGTV